MKKGIVDHRVGDSIDTFLLVKSMTKGLTTAGKPFLTLILQDKSGDIEAKLWDSTKEDEQLYVPGKIIKATGEITSFRGRNQLKLKTVRLTTEADHIVINDLLETAPIGQDVMIEKMTQYVFEMRNSNIQRMTRHLPRQHQEAFLNYPAATKNHHDFVSGLAYHVVSMLELAKAIANLYPSVDTDLLYAGVILHDLGKVKELSGSVAANYTKEGVLLGHISMMVSEIAQAANELGIEGEEVRVLQHLVLSHHGKAEWGSPKPPLIREAEILHMIDNIDAKMNMLDRALDRIEPGEFTEKIFPLDNRSFYKPNF